MAALQIGLDEGDPPGKKPPGRTPPAHRGPKPEWRAWMRACCWRGYCAGFGVSSEWRVQVRTRIGMYSGRWGPDRRVNGRCVLATPRRARSLAEC